MTKRTIGNFARDRRGNVAIIFAMAALPVVGIVGAAIDYGRVHKARTVMQAAADAAVMHAATQYNMTEAQRVQLAQQSYDANGGNLTPSINVTAVVTPGPNTLKMVASANVPTMFMGLMDVPSIEVGVNSTVSTAGKKLELSVMIDSTGSMQGQKLTDLKVALTEMLDIVMPTGQTNSRVAFVPFATTVNVGTTNTLNMTGRVNYPWAKCVTERKHGPRPNEAPPVKPVNEFWIKTNNNYCSSVAPIVPLTNNRTILNASMNSLVANGSTSGHSGTAWAWHMISPLWANRFPAGSKPASYTDNGTIKAVVIMSDGVYTYLNKKQNGYSGGCNGSSPCQPSINEGKAYCKAIKSMSKVTGSAIAGYNVNTSADVNSLDEQAILVFAVGFGLPAAGTWAGDKAREVMTYCASYDKRDSETDPSLKKKQYYFPVTGEDIRNTFSEIGRSLSEAINKPTMIN